MKKKITLVLGIPLIVLIFSRMFIIRYKHSRSFKTAVLSTVASIMFYLTLLFPTVAQAIDSVESFSTPQISHERSRASFKSRGPKKSSGLFKKRKKKSYRVSTSENTQKVCIFLRWDTPFHNEIIKIDTKLRNRAITEHVFSDSIVVANDLIEQSLIHTVQIKESDKVKTKKSKYRKFNRKMHTLSDLPARRGDIIINEELKTISSYDETTNQVRFKRLLGL